MTERVKAVFKAVRGDKEHMSTLLHTLLSTVDEQTVKIGALIAGMQALDAQLMALDEKVKNGNRPRQTAGRN